jgi:hypothetical protein
MKKSSPLPPLVGGTLAAAVLATLLAPHGWLIWVPVLLALVVAYRLSGTQRR